MTTRKNAGPRQAGKVGGQADHAGKSRQPRSGRKTGPGGDSAIRAAPPVSRDKPPFRRPDSVRTQPIRNWSGLFGGAVGGPGGSPPAAATVRGFMDAAASAATGAALPLGDAVARGVDLGYRVIDDYVRRGQQAARSTWSPSSQASGNPSAAGPADLQRLMERMLQYASDFTSVWFEMLNLATSTAGAAPPSGRAPTPGGAGPFHVGEVARGADADDIDGSPPAVPATASDSGSAAPGGTARRGKRSSRAEIHQTGKVSSDTKVSVQLSSRRRAKATVELRGALPVWR